VLKALQKGRKWKTGLRPLQCSCKTHSVEHEYSFEIIFLCIRYGKQRTRKFCGKKSRDHRRVKENAREYGKIFELLAECWTKIKTKPYFSWLKLGIY